MTYSSTVLADTPVGYWRLGETSGTAAADSSGNGIGGTYGGTYTLGDTGLIYADSDKAVGFNVGSVALPTAAALNITGALSIEAWIQASARATGNFIFGGYQNGGAFAGYGFRINSSTDATAPNVLSFWDGTAWRNGSTVVADGAVRYVAVTLDGSGNGIFYINGAPADTFTYSTLPSYSGVRALAGSTDGGTFLGTLDEVAVYNVKLTSAHVGDHWAAGTAPPTKHSFGVYVKDSTDLEAYKDGVRIGCYTTAAKTGTHLVISEFRGVGVHIDKVSQYDQPGGTLLASDDFSSLAAWTAGDLSGTWTINPSSNAFNNSNNGGDTATIGLTQNTSAKYFELEGVYFDRATDSPDGWVMLIPYRTNITGESDGTFSDGYRIFMRPSGTVVLPDGTSVPCPSSAGWGVGSCHTGQWSVGAVHRTRPRPRLIVPRRQELLI